MGPRAGPTRAENPAPTGIRFPDRPARNESLYSLSYPGTQMFVTCVVKTSGQQSAPKRLGNSFLSTTLL